MPEFRRQRSFKMAFSSSLTLVLWNICYANNERKPTGFVNRSGTGKSKRKEILKKIQFTSFSIRLRLMLAWKFMKINTYNIRQILQPSLYWQKQWRHHLFSEAAETVAIDFFLFWNTIPSSSPPLLRCRNQKETTGCVVVHPKSMDKAQQSIAAFVNGCRKSVSNTSLIFPRIMKQGKEQW